MGEQSGNIEPLYPFSAHGVLLGNHEHAWQQTEAVLSHFWKKAGIARKQYTRSVRTVVWEGSSVMGSLIPLALKRF
jgi:hypothetical protein